MGGSKLLSQSTYTADEDRQQLTASQIFPSRGNTGLRFIRLYQHNSAWVMMLHIFTWKGAARNCLEKGSTRDWMNHLSIIVYHGLTSTNHINSRGAPPLAEPIGKPNSDWSQSSEQKHDFHQQNRSVFYSPALTELLLQQRRRYLEKPPLFSSKPLLMRRWLVELLFVQPQAHILTPGKMDLHVPIITRSHKSNSW